MVTLNSLKLRVHRSMLFLPFVETSLSQFSFEPFVNICWRLISIGLFKSVAGSISKQRGGASHFHATCLDITLLPSASQDVLIVIYYPTF